MRTNPHLRNGLPRHQKTRGEIAEALFIAIATALGFRVSRPFGDNCPYDFVLDWHGHLTRIQLKSAWTLGRKPHGHSARYQIACGMGPNRKRRYTARDIDFLIAYIADGNCPADVVPAASAGKAARSAAVMKPETRNLKPETLVSGTWYVLPASVISNCLSAYFTANPSRSRFAQYRNAWELLRYSRRSTIS
jgi:hypothetical protein